MTLLGLVAIITVVALAIYGATIYFKYKNAPDDDFYDKSTLSKITLNSTLFEFISFWIAFIVFIAWPITLALLFIGYLLNSVRL